MADGADGIEFDVRLARDGVPVVIHDATLDRTGLTIGRIAELSSEELQRADVGSWFGRRLKSPSVDFAGERLPSLSQVFDFFGSNAGLLYLEMKTEAADDPRFATEVVRAIREHSLWRTSRRRKLHSFINSRREERRFGDSHCSVI